MKIPYDRSQPCSKPGWMSTFQAAQNRSKITQKSSKTALGPNIFLACGALKGASPRGPCLTAQNRLPWASPSYPSPPTTRRNPGARLPSSSPPLWKGIDRRTVLPWDDEWVPFVNLTRDLRAPWLATRVRSRPKRPIPAQQLDGSARKICSSLGG